MQLFDRLGRQPFVLVTLWVVAAVLAVLVGVVGIGVVGAGLTSRQGSPVSEAEVLREVTGLAPSAGPSVTPAPAPRTSTGSAPRSQSFPTRGGTVVATCQEIRSMAPAQGFEVHEQGRDEGEFRSTSDHHDRVKVGLTCAGGTPHLDVRSERR